MPNDRNQPPVRTKARFPFATLLGALIPALVATAVVVYISTRISNRAPAARADGLVLVTLSQKDAAFRPIPASAGGATGEVLYTPTGAALRLQLRARGLTPARRYVLEMQVDRAIYTVASYAPGADGGLSIDTTISRFEEGVCVGNNYDEPHSVSGAHVIKFWVKRDGSPVAGRMPGVVSSVAGSQLPCHGNGDGNYDYVLLENGPAHFTGSTAPLHDSTR
ncbi:MAG: hypothetical protein ABI446_05415 [Gemmatimonadaceae bacterium]